MDAPQWGESVIVRKGKTGEEGKIHGFIGLLSDDTHPAGHPLPCCGLKPTLLRHWLDEAQAGRLVPTRLVEVESAPGAGTRVPSLVLKEVPDISVARAQEPQAAAEPVNYYAILGNMPAQYILNAEKTLAAGKIGLLPPALESFFGQTGVRIVETRGIRPTFASGAVGFARLGVDNRIQNRGLNLFAALAPLLGYNSAEETQVAIGAGRFVRAFESANYGTLVQEFAARNTEPADRLERTLPAFAAEFGYDTVVNRPHVMRLLKAWVAFQKYVSDIRQPKQLRHFEHLLAMPGVLTPTGLLIATLEEVEGRIRVVCPSFGIPNASLFADVPVAFMWHDAYNARWEPLVLYANARQAITRFGGPEMSTLPAPMKTTIRKWLRDWRTASLGCGRPQPPPHVWTPNRDTRDLPRLSQLRSLSADGATLIALVRDRSNRLAGGLLTVGGAGAGAGEKMFVPCLDDGNLSAEFPRLFEAEAIPSVSISTYLRFYKRIATRFPGLSPTQVLVRIRDQVSIVGFITAVGTMVPTAPSELANAEGLPVAQIDEFPWERDAIVIRQPDAESVGTATGFEESTASVDAQLAEAYEHLRLSLARWLIRDPRGAEMRANIIDLTSPTATSSIFLYERRKRMDILLEPLVGEWIVKEVSDRRVGLDLLRKDCLAIESEGECVGACRWSGGRCLIHAPVREEAMDPVRIFTARLSDELLLYSEKMRSLLDNRVEAIRVPRGIVRRGNELYMSVKPKEAVSDLVQRLGITGQTPTMTFPEEVLSFEGLEEEDSALEAGVGAGAGAGDLPESWMREDFRLADIPPDVDNPMGYSFAQSMGYTLEKLEGAIKTWRKKLKMPGNPDRPVQWSTQDLYVLAYPRGIDIIIARQSADGTGRVVIDEWIHPEKSTADITKREFFVFWGVQRILLLKGTAVNIRYVDLPVEIQGAIDVASPLSTEAAKGYVDVTTA
jgi:hypothetical protein